MYTEDSVLYQPWRSAGRLVAMLPAVIVLSGCGIQRALDELHTSTRAATALIGLYLIQEKVHDQWDFSLCYDSRYADMGQPDPEWGMIYDSLVATLHDEGDVEGLTWFCTDLKDYVEDLAGSDRLADATGVHPYHQKLRNELGLPANLRSVHSELERIRVGETPDPFHAIVTGFVLNQLGRGELTMDFVQHGDQVLLQAGLGKYNDWLFKTTEFPVDRRSVFIEATSVAFPENSSVLFALTLTPEKERLDLTNFVLGERVRFNILQSVYPGIRVLSDVPPGSQGTRLDIVFAADLTPMWNAHAEMIWVGDIHLEGSANRIARVCIYPKR